MRMFNADGSEAEMCGNGIRCLAKYVYDHGIARKPTLRIETGAGVLSLDLEVESGKVARVRVDMGAPILEADRIPVKIPGVAAQDRLVNVPLERVIGRASPRGFDDWQQVCGLDARLTAVSMGNPHITLYCKNVKAVPLEVVGPWLETQPAFPARMNVHFVELQSPREVTVRHWERGSGPTQACGTGASSVCVAGVLAGRTERRLLAHLPGGDLQLEWNEQDGHVYMTGPATEVFSGEWNGVADSSR
jgi:diaminopimelate epimerase